MNLFLKNFGDYLNDYGEVFSNFCVLNSNLRKTLSLDSYKKKNELNFFEFGSSVENMISAGAGISAMSKVPVLFANSSDIFYRAYGNLRNDVAINNLNLKIVGLWEGLDAAKEGVEKLCLDDIALARLLPNFKIFIPSHVLELKKMFEEMMECYGPVYLRFDTRLIEQGDLSNMGKFSSVKKGKNIVIFSCGSLISVLSKVLERIKVQDFEEIELVNVPKLPFDLSLLEKYRNYETILLVEEHVSKGGLVEYFREKNLFVNLIAVDLNDLKSGDCESVKNYYGFTEDVLYKKIKNFL